LDPCYGHIRHFVKEALKKSWLYTRGNNERYRVNLDSKTDGLLVTRENGSICKISGVEINRYLARTRNDISFMRRLGGHTARANGTAKWLEPITQAFSAHLHRCACFARIKKTEAIDANAK
jgi:hypothetical protein